MMTTQALQKLKIAIIGLEWDVVDLIDSMPELEIAGFIEPTQSDSPIPYLGKDEDWETLVKADPDLRALLSLDSPDIREQLFTHYDSQNLITLISPNAHVSKRAIIGHGSLLQRGVTVMPNVQIGEGSKLNVNATVHHDVQIGSFTTLAPGSQILGRVVIEENVYVGAGVIIRQRCRIGRGVIIGAGAVVVNDIPPNTTVAGVPAKKLVL